MKQSFQTAPDMPVVLSDKSETRLAVFWEKHPVALVFLRHFGWPFCRRQVAGLRDTAEAFEAVGLEVVLVGMGRPRAADAFKKAHDLPFALICDPDRKLYKAFEIGRMRPWDMLSPTVALEGIAAMGQGHLMGFPAGDVLQKPGTFIIDTTGKIIFSHYAKTAADHMEPEEILEVFGKL